MVICRLCLNECRDFKNLYNDDDQCNELHLLLCRYFHPQTLNMEEAKHLRCICLECFRHIVDFNSFQASINLAQLKLLDTGQTGEPVKLESLDLNTSIETKSFNQTNDMVVGQNEISNKIELETKFLCGTHGYPMPHNNSLDEETSNGLLRENNTSLGNSNTKSQKTNISRKELCKNKLDLKMFTCDQCKQTFDHKRQLLRHIRYTHHSKRNPPESSKNESNQTPLSRLPQNQSKELTKLEPICHTNENSPRINRRRFSNAFIYTFTKNIYKTNKSPSKRHQWTPEKELSPNISNKTTPNGLYCCVHCSKIFTNYSKYSSHTVLKHNTRHICATCGLTFEQRTHYRHHILQHKNEDVVITSNCSTTTTENGSESNGIVHVKIEQESGSDEEIFTLRYDTD
ncbi:oocyte zinc finger protein XlCOF8.4-like isoform X2 [Musca domestica]|nr:oocyte zinc finger protein XlCOF8.4-like isoform X2 [Musca domestica]